MAEKRETSSTTSTDAEQCALHTAYYHASTCAIKDDVNALAANWVRQAQTATCLQATHASQSIIIVQTLTADALDWLCRKVAMDCCQR